MNIDKIDLNYAMSNNFNYNHLPKNDKGVVSYGFKTLAIINYIIGIHKTNLNKCRNKNKKDHKYFWNQQQNKYILIQSNQCVIKYKTIAKRFACSEELVKKVVHKLTLIGMLKHFRFQFDDHKFSNSWIFEILWNEFVPVFKSLRVLNKKYLASININDNLMLSNFPNGINPDDLVPDKFPTIVKDDKINLDELPDDRIMWEWNDEE